MSDVDRNEIAQRAGLPDGFGDRLRGSTAEELDADASELATALGVGPEPEHVRLARQAIAAAESNPNRGELLALIGHNERKAQLARLLADPEGQADAQPAGEGPPNFDGGARESAPPEPDALADHNQTVLEVLRNPGGGGGEW